MKRKLMGTIFTVLLLTTGLEAKHFWVVGKIKRTLVDHYYGGAMIYLDRAIGNGCPSRWVSLDTKGRYWNKEDGKNKFSSALSAFAMDKRVAVYIYSHQKHNGYCVARRIDILK